MTEFIETIRAVPVLQNALIAGAIASVTFGVIGTLVVTRRIGYIAAAISHSILGGIGASIYFSRVHDLPWLTPMLGAIVAAILSALAIGWVSLRFREREDTAISAIWACGMATGLLFLHHAPGKAVVFESYIFGNILMTSKADLIATLVLGMIVLAVVALCYHKLIAVCFDDEFARLRGVSSGFYYILLLILTGICMVLLVRVAGIILSLTLMIIPAATASQFARRMWVIMVAAVLLSIGYNVGGLALSFQLDLPTAPFIAVVACVIYLVVVAIGARRLVARFWERR